MGINPFNYSAIGGEIVGGLELVGDDDESLSGMLGIMGDDDDDDDIDDLNVGAATKRKIRKILAVKKAKAKMGVQQVQTQGNFGRYLIAGGRATQGAVTGSIDVVATLQEAFRPQRMTISLLDAAGLPVSIGGLVITDILCGTRSQLSSLGSVPAGMFSNDSTQGTAGFLFDTVGPGCAFVVRFQSVTALFSVVVGVSGTALR